MGSPRLSATPVTTPANPPLGLLLGKRPAPPPPLLLALLLALLMMMLLLKHCWNASAAAAAAAMMTPALPLLSPPPSPKGPPRAPPRVASRPPNAPSSAPRGKTRGKPLCRREPAPAVIPHSAGHEATARGPKGVRTAEKRHNVTPSPYLRPPPPSEHAVDKQAGTQAVVSRRGRSGREPRSL